MRGDVRDDVPAPLVQGRPARTRRMPASDESSADPRPVLHCTEPNRTDETSAPARTRGGPAASGTASPGTAAPRRPVRTRSPANPVSTAGARRAWSAPGRARSIGWPASCRGSRDRAARSRTRQRGTSRAPSEPDAASTGRAESTREGPGPAEPEPDPAGRRRNKPTSPRSPPPRTAVGEVALRRWCRPRDREQAADQEPDDADQHDSQNPQVTPSSTPGRPGAGRRFGPGDVALGRRRHRARHRGCRGRGAAAPGTRRRGPGPLRRGHELGSRWVGAARSGRPCSVRPRGAGARRSAARRASRPASHHGPSIIGRYSSPAAPSPNANPAAATPGVVHHVGHDTRDQRGEDRRRATGATARMPRGRRPGAGARGTARPAARR